MQDAQCERIVLRELIRHPIAAAIGCDAAGLERGHFFHDHYGRLYDTARYLIAGPTKSAGVYDLYLEIERRRDTGMYFDTRGQLARWIAGISYEPPWFDDVQKWWPRDFESVAAAASLKVVWLASRRAMYYKAQELIRDAVNPVGGADENFNR